MCSEYLPFGNALFLYWQSHNDTLWFIDYNFSKWTQCNLTSKKYITTIYNIASPKWTVKQARSGWSAYSRKLCSTYENVAWLQGGHKTLSLAFTSYCSDPRGDTRGAGYIICLYFSWEFPFTRFRPQQLHPRRSALRTNWLPVILWRSNLTKGTCVPITKEMAQ